MEQVKNTRKQQNANETSYKKIMNMKTKYQILNQNTQKENSPLNRSKVSVTPRSQSPNTKKKFCAIHPGKKVLLLCQVKFYAMISKLKVYVCSNCAVKLAQQHIQVHEMKKKTIINKTKSKSPAKKTPTKRISYPKLPSTEVKLEILETPEKSTRVQMFLKNIKDIVEKNTSSVQSSVDKMSTQTFNQESLDELIGKYRDSIEKNAKKRQEVGQTRKDLTQSYHETTMKVQDMYIQALQAMQVQKDQILKSLENQFMDNHLTLNELDQNFDQDHSSMSLIFKDLENSYSNICQNFENPETSEILNFYQQALQKQTESLQSSEHKLIYNDVYSLVEPKEFCQKEVENISIFKNPINFISFEADLAKSTSQPALIDYQQTIQKSPQKKVGKFVNNFTLKGKEQKIPLGERPKNLRN